MAREGKIRLAEFVVVDQRVDKSRPKLHTSQPYPEWYLSAMKGTDKTLAKRTTAASLALKAGSEADKRARIKGFAAPVPTESMKSALRRRVSRVRNTPDASSCKIEQ